jgi:hypothetical protein
MCYRSGWSAEGADRADESGLWDCSQAQAGAHVSQRIAS